MRHRHAMELHAAPCSLRIISAASTPSGASQERPYPLLHVPLLLLHSLTLAQPREKSTRTAITGLTILSQATCSLTLVTPLPRARNQPRSISNFREIRKIPNSRPLPPWPEIEAVPNLGEIEAATGALCFPFTVA